MLDWNELALACYRAIGASRWTSGRFSGSRATRSRLWRQARQQSAIVSDVTGSRRSGAISASGSSTNRRSRKPGCGTVSPGSCRIARRRTGSDRDRGCGRRRETAARARDPFDVQQRVQATRRAAASCRRRRRRSEKPAEHPGTSHRRGFDRGRDPEVRTEAWRDDRGQTLDARSAIAEVGTDARSRQVSGYSIQRVGSTSPTRGPTSSVRRPSRSCRPASACSKKRFCSSVSPRITLQHPAVACVGHRVDARPPAIDERLRLARVLARRSRAHLGFGAAGAAVGSRPVVGDLATELDDGLRRPRRAASLRD